MSKNSKDLSAFVPSCEKKSVKLELRNVKGEQEKSFSLQNSHFSVPKLRFSEFRDSEGWKERPLSEFLRESRLSGSKGNVAKKITVKLWGNGVFEKNEAIQGSINTQYFRRKAGQFIYSKLDFLNQAFGIISPSLDGFESTVDLPCFDFADGLNPVFLLEYVKRRDFYERLGETADGSRKAKRIHAETFLSFPIALPKLPEQQKIADCLSSIDELIAAQARKVDALKTHKKRLMQQLFPREGETQPRLRFPKFEVELKVVGFTELGEIKIGLTHKPEYVKSGKPFLSSRNISNGYIDFENIKYISEEKFLSMPKSTKPIVGDILFTRVGSNLGNPIILEEDREFGIFVSLGFFRPKKNVCNYYIKHWMDSDYFWRQVKQKVAGGAKDNLNTTWLKEFKLSIPSLPEQQRIATCLNSLDELIAAQTQKLKAFKTHKKGLMQQLFPFHEEVV